MFESSPQNYWLLALLILWAAFLFGGFVFGKLDDQRTRRMPAWTRMASSLVLVVAAWSGFLFNRNTQIESFALLIAIGMTLGFIGDLFMAELIPISDHVMAGIAAFGLGHVAYIIAFLKFGDEHGLNDSGARWGAWVFWLFIGVIGWHIVVFRGQKPTPLHYAALPYALLLASTAGYATGLALQHSAFIPLAVGTALFLLSDLILAAQLFNNLRFYLISDVVWLTYGPAQMLIVYTVGNALSVL
jgi:YhhN-like protein